MLDAHPNTPQLPVGAFLSRRKLPAGWLFFAWHVWATAGSYPWKALSLYNTVPGG